MTADHTITDKGDEAAIVVSISAGNVALISRGRGRPRGRGSGRSMCARVLYVLYVLFCLHFF